MDIIPICWKCRYVIIRDSDNPRLFDPSKFAGCEQDDTIKTYENAKVKCPAIGGES